MGNYTSKIFTNHGESDNKSKLQTPNGSGNWEKHQCTPIMTRRCLSADPRSATIGIVRTPIEVDATPTGVSKRTASAIPKYLQIKPYLETDIDSVMDTLTPERRIPDPRSPNITCQRTPIIVKSESEYASPPVKVNEIPEIDILQHPMNALDPRSPAINFDRTPIMKPKSPGNVDKIPHEHVSKCDIESPNLPMLYCETTIDYILPEVQALPKIVSYKPLSFEKRLDACNDTLEENNLKCESNTDVSSQDSNSEGQITVIPNVNALTNNLQSSSIYDAINEELENTFADVNNGDPINIISRLTPDSGEHDGANGKIRVWRDSISPTCLAESKVEVFKAPKEIIIEFDDEPTVVKSYNKLDSAEEKADDNKINNGIFVGMKKTKQLNRDSKHIYEDSKDCTVNGAVVIDTHKNRMPLGNRSNNHKSAKSPQMLLRNKGLSTKSQQQENTPPRTKRGKSTNKSNPTQWDLDRTVVI